MVVRFWIHYWWFNFGGVIFGYIGGHFILVNLAVGFLAVVFFWLYFTIEYFLNELIIYHAEICIVRSYFIHKYASLGRNKREWYCTANVVYRCGDTINYNRHRQTLMTIYYFSFGFGKQLT